MAGHAERIARLERENTRLANENSELRTALNAAAEAARDLWFRVRGALVTIGKEDGR